MHRARAAIAILAVLPAAVMATGCGEGSDDDAAGGFAALIERLPADSASLYATDVAAARTDLGLESDADAIDVEAAFGSGIEQDDPLQRLVRDTSTSLPPLAEELAGGGVPPALEALDGGAIQAVASTGPGEIQVTAISTSQDFDAIADALGPQGYTRSGDVLSASSGAQTIGGVADAGNGIVILARSSQQAEAAIGQDPASGALNDAIAGVDEPVRVAQTGSDCVATVAVGQAADAASGSVRLRTTGDADAAGIDRKALEDAEPGFEFAEPSADGSELTIEFSGDAPALGSETPAETLGQTFTVYSAYNCG